MSFAGLLASPGVEERCVLRSRFGFLALHGGLERATAELATEAAQRAGASVYAVVQPPDLRWHVPSLRFDPGESPRLAAFLAHVEVVVSLHGYGGLRASDDRWTTVLVGGGNRVLAGEFAARMRVALPQYSWLDDVGAIPRSHAGVHPANPVNHPRGGGVQLELPPRLRGYGRYWATFDGDGWPPHSAVLLDELAAFATDKLEHITIKNLDS